MAEPLIAERLARRSPAAFRSEAVCRDSRRARAATRLVRPSVLLPLIFLLCFPSASRAAANAPHALEDGFTRMYQLDFSEARLVFDAYIQQHPDDPMGQVSLAASYLFEEFNKQGVLTSSFFLNNKKLLGGVPNPGQDEYQAKFLKANARAREMAQKLLDANPNDRTGLFVITLANGMEADYDALIAKHDIDSVILLHETKKTARKLLAIDPGADDAYLALGAANYIIGCLPGYKRFFLGLGGIHGSRKLGMHQLRLAAERGHYLKPFAKVMLALAALREKQPDLARRLFSELHDQFPENDVFASELSKLE